MGLFPRGHSRMVTPKWASALEAQRAFAARSDAPPAIEGIDPIFHDTNPAYSLFPNLITPLDAPGFPVIQLWPIDAETTEVEWTHYAPPPPTPEVDETWRAVFDRFDVVMDEDFANLGPMQRSVASGALRSIPLNYQERRIYHLHEEIDRVIGPWVTFGMIRIGRIRKSM